MSYDVLHSVLVMTLISLFQRWAVAEYPAFAEDAFWLKFDSLMEKQRFGPDGKTAIPAHLRHACVYFKRSMTGSQRARVSPSSCVGIISQIVPGPEGFCEIVRDVSETYM